MNPPMTARLRSFIAERPALQRSVAAGLILVGGVTTATALIATTPETPAEEPEERAWPVSAEAARPTTHAPVIAAFGRIESASVTQLEARLIAPIAEVLVREGERVEAGQLLVRLDDVEARFALSEREAELMEAGAELATTRNAARLAERTTAEEEAMLAMSEARLTRFAALHEQGMIARDIHDEVREDAARARIAIEAYRTELADFPHRIAMAEARVQRAEVARDRAALALSRTEVRAPFPGPIAEVAVARGDQVMTGTPLVTLVDETSVEVRVPLPADDAERLRARLAQGHDAMARMEVAGESVAVPLARLAGDQKAGSTVVDAFFRLDARHGAQVGRVVDVRVALPEEHDVVAIPVQALYENDRIYRIEDERLVAMDAEFVGEAADVEGYRVLLRVPELRADDRIVTTQLPGAITGLKVKAVGFGEQQVAAQGEHAVPALGSG